LLFHTESGSIERKMKRKLVRKIAAASNLIPYIKDLMISDAEPEEKYE
jgi:hypothetical protein